MSQRRTLAASKSCFGYRHRCPRSSAYPCWPGLPVFFTAMRALCRGCIGDLHREVFQCKPEVEEENSRLWFGRKKGGAGWHVRSATPQTRRAPLHVCFPSPTRRCARRPVAHVLHHAPVLRTAALAPRRARMYDGESISTAAFNPRPDRLLNLGGRNYKLLTGAILKSLLILLPNAQSRDTHV